MIDRAMGDMIIAKLERKKNDIKESLKNSLRDSSNWNRNSETKESH